MIKYKALRQIRLDKGWTQGHAARQIGIQQSYLSKLENNQAIPSPEILEKISSTYHCQMSDIALVNVNSTERPKHLGKGFYIGLCLTIVGILFIAPAYFGIVKNNTAYTYQLTHTQFESASNPVLMPNFIVTDEFMGEKYREPSQDTEAVYILLGERPISPLTNRVLYFIGVILVVIGLALQIVRLVKNKKQN